MSFNEEEHYQDANFDEDQDLPSRTEEDVYSDEDRVMDLPPSSRSRVPSFKPPVINPTPRT